MWQKCKAGLPLKFDMQLQGTSCRCHHCRQGSRRYWTIKLPWMHSGLDAIN